MEKIGKMEYISLKRTELLEIANQMLLGKLNFIKGIREICFLRYEIDDAENEVFLPFLAIETNTDDYPIGKVREICDEKYLQEIDAEMKIYLSRNEQYILDACKEILKTYG